MKKSKMTWVARQVLDLTWTEQVKHLRLTEQEVQMKPVQVKVRISEARAISKASVSPSVIFSPFPQGTFATL